jgi:hypothetical protein
MSSLLSSAVAFTILVLVVAQTNYAFEVADGNFENALRRLYHPSEQHSFYTDVERLGKRMDPRTGADLRMDPRSGPALITADQSPHPPIYRFKNEKFNLIRALNLNLQKNPGEPPQLSTAAVGVDGGTKQTTPLRSTLRDILRLGRLPHSPQAFLQLLMM